MDAKGVRNMWSILVVVNKHNTARVASCWFIIYYDLSTLNKMLNTADSPVSFGYYHIIIYCLTTLTITQNMTASNDYLMTLSVTQTAELNLRVIRA